MSPVELIRAKSQLDPNTAADGTGPGDAAPSGEPSIDGPPYVPPVIRKDEWGNTTWTYPDGSTITASSGVTIENNDKTKVDHIDGTGTVSYNMGNGTTATAVIDADGTASDVTNANGHNTRIMRPASGGLALTIDGEEYRHPTEAHATVAAARSYLGTSYAWGAGSTFGPTKGEDDNGDGATQNGDYNKVGYDCEGLVRYAVFQATGHDIGPGTFNQIDSPDGRPVPLEGTDGLAAARPGDLLFFADPNTPPHHVGVYSGDGMLIEAPESGEFVQEVPVSTHSDLSAIRRFR